MGCGVLGPGHDAYYYYYDVVLQGLAPFIMQHCDVVLWGSAHIKQCWDMVPLDLGPIIILERDQVPSPHYDITVGHGSLRLALVTWCPWTGPRNKQTLCLSPHYDIAMEHGAVRLALGLAPIMII